MSKKLSIEERVKRLEKAIKFLYLFHYQVTLAEKHNVDISDIAIYLSDKLEELGVDTSLSLK